jgi:hypothetical protein
VHDRVDFKHAIDADDLIEDARPRTLLVDGLTHRHDPLAPERALDGYRADGSAAGGAVGFCCDVPGGEVRKRIACTADGLRVEWRLRGLAGQRLTTRMNLSMPSCDGFSGRYVLSDGTIPCGFGQFLAPMRTSALVLEDGELGGRLSLTADRTAEVCAAPYHTVSLSEGGFEKIMQAAEVVFTFDVDADDTAITLEIEAKRA